MSVPVDCSLEREIDPPPPWGDSPLNILNACRAARRLARDASLRMHFFVQRTYAVIDWDESMFQIGLISFLACACAAPLRRYTSCKYVRKVVIYRARKSRDRRRTHL